MSHNKVLHLAGPALRFFKASRSLQPARQVNAVVRPQMGGCSMAENVVIGPMLTAYGFRSWYWVCRPTQLVAVRAGFWVAVAASMPGAYGGLVGALAGMPGHVKGNKLTARLFTATDEHLAEMPRAVVYKREDVEA